MKIEDVIDRRRVLIKTISPYVIALRPHHWVKNLIVFAAPLFAFQVNADTLLVSSATFILFCCVSSSFYIFNDIADLEFDRRHPIKSRRPIAAGVVNVPIALGIASLLLGISLVSSWVQSYRLGAIFAIYSLLQAAYNLKLKRIVILDIMSIAAGFVLRAYAGGVSNKIILSPWLLLCTSLLALFLGIEKRKAELRWSGTNAIETRVVLYRYSLPLLTRMESIVTTGIIVTYALWSFGPQLKGATTSWMMVTLPFVLYGTFRYQLLSDPEEVVRRNGSLDYEVGEQCERPEEVLLRDLPILLNTFGWALASFIVLFLKSRGYIQ